MWPGFLAAQIVREYSLLLIFLCKIFPEKLDKARGGRRGILDAAHDKHNLAEILGLCGAADHTVGIFGEDQLSHVTDAQVVFNQGEDQIASACSLRSAR